MNGPGIEQLLLKLKASDIHVRLVDDRLRVSAPEEGLSTELRDELNASKHELLDFLKAAKPDENSSIPKLVAANDVSLAPLSFGQQRSWLMHELNKEQASPYDTLNINLRNQGALNVDALESSLAEILRRHEVLRTIFVLNGNEPVQVIKAAFPVLEQEDISHLPAAERETGLRKCLQEARNTLFDLSSGPLFRARLVRLDKTEHVLQIMVHHIIFDDWSKTIFLRELSLLYQHYSQGLLSPLPELPIQYRDFSIWQRNWLQGEVLQKNLGYWAKQLADLPMLELPTDYSRPAKQTFNGAIESLSLPPELLAGLQALSKQRGVTLYMTMLSVLGILLNRYSSQNDIGVGAAIANRDSNEVQNLIGFFLNMLVMRLDLSAEPSFVELLERVKRMALRGYAHQHLPFEKLVEELQPERSTNRTPLFQVTFTMLEAPDAEPTQSNGLELSPISDVRRTARFDLEVYVSEGPDGLALGIVYNTDLFAASSIKRMLAHYNELLQGVVDDPSRCISDLSMLDRDERHLLLEQWNQTQTDYPREQSVPALFEQQAAATPGAIALDFGGETLSYAELNTRANQLAHYLQARGVGPEVMVGLYLERDLDMVIGLLGILKAGGAYVPLDLDYPPPRIAFMLEDAAAPVLLTHSTLCEQLPDYAGELICLDRDWPAIDAEAVTNPDSGSTADNLAYVIYTSGSTGRPKGVEIRHRAIVRLVRNTDFYQVAPTDRVAQASNISFDAATFELWGALLNGGQLVGVNKDVLLNPQALANFLQQQRISAMFLTTALFNQIAREVPAAFSGLSGLMFGGEAVDPGAVREVLQHGPPARLLHVYGPTESTTFASWYRVEEVPAAATTVPIGRPLANTTLYVLDKHRQPVPIGVPGELCIGGDGLARGYLHQAEVTAEKFIANPFSSEPEARLYCTGDLVRTREDGAIEYMGRIDQQVKLRGFRIELGEIETQLIRHDVVKDAVAMLREDEPGDKRLVAYVVPTQAWLAEHPRDEHADLDSEAGASSLHQLIPELRQYIRTQLPTYMEPSAFIVLDELPLNPNGKVDRKALPLPADVQDGREVEYTAPRTELEEQLTQIWADVLKVAQVGIHDNFFDLGGHSLMVTQVVSRIREQLNVELPLADMFNLPSVAELAPVVQSLLDDGNGEETDLIVAVDREGDLPLSFAQERLWFLDRLQPENPVYIIPMALRLKGELHVDALLASLNAIVDRHEALRTRFADSPSGPLQIIDDSLELKIDQIDLTTLAPEERERQVSARQQAEKAQAFDLTTGPLIRGSLLRLSAAEHVLLLTMHHIVSDGWSLGLLFGELGKGYAAFSRGEQPALVELPIQYADFAAWQRQWLSGEELVRQQDYWGKQLEDLQVLELPADRSRPAILTYDGAHEFLALDNELSEQLERLSKDNGVTLFMTLLTVFMVMLHRYSGQDDIALGTPIANRNRSEVEGLIAFFVNMLVMRADCSGHPGFNDLVQRVSEMALGAYAHQDIPFERLVDMLQVDRDQSRNPLFQVQFALQNAPLEAFELPGLTLAPVAAETQVTRFDLECHISDKTDQLRVNFVYNTNLFDATTIQQMQRHFANLLAAVVAEPDKSIDLLPMLGRDERHLLLEQWPQTQTDYPREQTVPALFEQQVAASPDAIALEYEGARLSYTELNERANQLAHYLQAKGVGPEVMVGISVERSLEMVIGLLGILKAGGAYLPLDADYPQSRLDFMLADAEVPVLLTQSSLQAQFESFAGATVCLDSEWPTIAGESTDNPTSDTDANSLMYAIYTSGSTGQPKGTLIEHRSAVRLVKETNYVELGADEVFLQFAPISFDASTLELWGSLLNGARLVVFPAGRSSLEELGRVIENKGVTTLWLTSALFSQMVDNHLQSLSGVRQLLAGGEALSLPHVRKMIEHLGENRLINGYGPTENTTFTCCHVMTRDSQLGQSVPIGRPISNTTVYILDRQMNPVPVGVAGELYIGGDGLARGYLHQPELTAQKFVADPFDDDPTARLYATGDLVRYRADGSIEFIGRIDHQVKVRGYRIELGEIETALTQQDSVSEAAALVRADEAGDKRLVAYVVPTSEWKAQHPRDEKAELDPETGELLHHELIPELRQQLRNLLPAYMVPSLFVVLGEFPLNSNGKLERSALPEPGEQAGAEIGYVAPRTELEEQLVRIWAEVLRLERVGIHDNFFDLGGHSLMATQVVSRIREQMNVELPLAEMFSYPTVAELAPVVELILDESSGDESSAIVAVARGADLPLSFAQQRMWFLEQLEPGSSAYNIPDAIKLRGALDIEALRGSLQEIVNRHEVLRTTFAVLNGQPIQKIANSLDIELLVEDLSAIAEPQQSIELQHILNEDASRPFDLATGPLLRSRLFQLAQDEHILMLCMHHITADGWSLGIFIRELSALYAAFCRGQPSPLPPLSVQYADFTLWQRQWLMGEALQAQLDYWKKQLAGVENLQLPTDRARPAVQTYAGAYASVILDSVTTAQLENINKQQAVTPFMTLLAAFSVLLKRYSGQEDIVVGSPIANRGHRDIEDLIGFFVNTLVFRTDVSGNPSFRELLGRVKKVSVDAYGHQDLPFETLVDDLQLERDRSRNPLFQVLFSVQNAPSEKRSLEGLTLESKALELKTTRFDLELHISQVAEHLAMKISYNTDLFNADSIERMLLHYRTLLVQIAANPECRIDDLELLGKTEYHQVVDEWNQTELSFPGNLQTVHELFEAQAQRTPEAVALEFEGESTNYRELNRRANQLAHYLAERGVGPDSIVGICLLRGPDLIVAVLAVLKAGGGYTPLDPAYPRDRLGFMLENSQAVILLTQTDLVQELPTGDIPVVCLDGDSQWTDYSDQNPVIGSHANNTAYLIYTSGSTGRPKGIVMEHRVLCNLIQWQLQRSGKGGSGRTLQYSALSFDVSFQEMFSTLCAGGTLVLVKESLRRNPEQLLAFLDDAEINRLFMPFAGLNQLTEVAQSSGRIPRSLQEIITAGEALQITPALEYMFEQLDGCSLDNQYGPSETHVVTACRLQAQPSGWPRLPSIGRPIANAAIYLLDERLRPVPVGVPGLMYIGGACLARGYLGRVDLTDEKFIVNPFREQGDARLYCTGDLARYAADGSIEFMGRADGQVKLRGYRIEPGEIEAVILEHDAVQACVVMVREDQPGDHRLVAYYVGVDIAQQELRACMKKKLPEYMLPSILVEVESLPLTPSGKVDRRQLPAPGGERQSGVEFVEPCTKLERQLAGIWQDLLGVDQVGINDNFFQLGGHSLMVTRVASRISDSMKLDLSVANLFEHTTIAELAEYIETTQWAKQNLDYGQSEQVSDRQIGEL